MGIRKNVDYDKFPKQKSIGLRVDVCFRYETSRIINGIIVRFDVESPYVQIIKLDDGRFVLSTECQWSFAQ
jgi:hypothetical protein